MSLNWLIILTLVCVGLAWTNPDHHSHHATLSPVFLEYIDSAHGDALGSIDADWTFLPKTLAYRNYYLFSTTSFPGNVDTARTPADGILTLGMLGKVFVLFPKAA